MMAPGCEQRCSPPRRRRRPPGLCTPPLGAAFFFGTPANGGWMSAEDLQLAINTVWVVVAAVLVLFMQLGFAMLEVGFSRGKNVGAVVGKILVNVAISTVIFWCVGFAIAF